MSRSPYSSAAASRLSLRTHAGILLLAASLVPPLWAAPADVMDSPAPLPGDPAPKTRDIKVEDATVSTQTGALEYSYPLTLPPGRGGAVPKVSLAYSSRAPIYGGIAQGWSLPIPEIRRDKVGRHSRGAVGQLAGRQQAARRGDERSRAL
jgi:hypothetical protein